jgi:hypothetical protein
MTRGEFARVAVVLDECWPNSGPFTDTAEAAYFAVLRSRPVEQVEQALERLVAQGQRWRPTPSEISVAAGKHLNADRLRLFQMNMRFYVERYGRDLAVELLDPQGQLQEHYPPEALTA